jgi:hypothetical protein
MENAMRINSFVHRFALALMPVLVLASSQTTTAQIVSAQQSAGYATQSAQSPRNTATSPFASGVATVVVVKVSKPWYAPNMLVVRKMRSAIPQYTAIPGLMFKAFTLARHGGEFGGVYLWRDRASAEAWFAPAWYARVRKERGVEPDVRMFEAPLVFSTPASAAVRPETLENAVVTLVTVPLPSHLDRESLRRGAAAAAKIERNASGLMRKYALLGEGRMGGAYLWRDEASARAWFDLRWQTKMRDLYGVAPEVEWLDAPILLPSTAPANQAAERALFVEAAIDVDPGAER